jgi:nicotinate-nucleotide--dimethylbenzimidazole phosphoribosyltransferase
MILQQVISSIGPTDVKLGEQAQSHIDSLTKPLGSLGMLESTARKLTQITGEIKPNVFPPGVLVMAADHGIAEEGVSAFPQSVTVQMVHNFLQGGAAINVFARQIQAMLQIVDVGVKEQITAEDLLQHKVRAGTANFAQEDAMQRDEAVRSLEVGIQCAREIIDQGARCLILGEMGIGNTTTSSAMLACFNDKNTDNIIGLGTGIDREKLVLKQQVIEKAIANRNPDLDDPIDILSKVGGLELGAMAGAMLYAASKQVPILLDGFICTTAALLAVRLSPPAADYMIAGHLSEEPGHAVALKLLGLEPLLKLNLRLGEGSGAAAAYPILQMAAAMVKEMATFESAGVSTQ